MIVAESHPAQFIADFLRSRSDIVRLELSVYNYRPRTVKDERRIVQVAPWELLPTFEALSWRLAPDEDIAFHSRVTLAPYMPSPQRHLALLDLQGDTSLEGHASLQQLIRERLPDRVALFSSGRSYHLYGLSLLTQEEWVQFMGRSLLLNMPGREEVVDSRWIGHRLLAGYGALRWTKNSARYIAEPRLLQVFEY